MTSYPLLLIPVQPWAKKRPRISKGGRRTHQDPLDKAAEEKTREFLRSQWCDVHCLAPLTKNVELQVVFYRRTRQVVDLDNLLKHLLDSGNGLLWGDDRQVTRYVAELQVDATYPRTEVVLHDHQTTMVRVVSTGP